MQNSPPNSPHGQARPAMISNMRMIEPRYSQRHHANFFNFSLRRYSQLTQADMLALAHVLKHSHSCACVPASVCRKTICQEISKLPSQLRSKIPWLSALCSLHRRLNTLPIISIRDAVKGDVHHELVSVWTRTQPSYAPQLQDIPSQSFNTDPAF